MKILLGALAPLLSIGAAVAADLPSRPAAYYAAPVFSWTGFYAGVTAGGAWNSTCGSVSPYYTGIPGAVAAAFPGCGGNSSGRFVGGATAGYNWQTGALVMGVEGDINFATNRSNNSGFVYTGVGPLPTGTYLATGNSNPNTFGTLRLRAGYAIDRLLLYATGGIVFGNGSRSAGLSYTATGNVAPTAVFSGSSSGSNVGWALGAGAEYAFTNNWTLKGEYLYLGTSGNNNNVTGGACVGTSCATFVAIPGLQFNNGSSRGESVVRVGLNYKFGS